MLVASEVRLGIGRVWEAFPVQEGSRRKRSGEAARKAGKKAKRV